MHWLWSLNIIGALVVVTVSLHVIDALLVVPVSLNVLKHVNLGHGDWGLPQYM